MPDKRAGKLNRDVKALPYITVQRTSLSPLKSGTWTAQYDSKLQPLTQVVDMRTQHGPLAQSWKNIAKYPALSAAMRVHTGTVSCFAIHVCQAPTGKRSGLLGHALRRGLRWDAGWDRACRLLPTQASWVTAALPEAAARSVSSVSKKSTTTTWQQWQPKPSQADVTQEGGVYNALFYRDRELKDLCSPPSLSLLSAQAVSMATLHPGPLQPLWQTHCQLFWPSVHLPLPLHKSGQPSGRRNGEGKYKTHSFAQPLRLLTILLCRQKSSFLLVGQTLSWPRATALGWRSSVRKGDTSEKWGLNSGQKAGGVLPTAVIHVLRTR